MSAVLSWSEGLQRISSKGATAARPGSLAGLHERRREHQGQFFTPAELVTFIWAMMEASLKLPAPTDVRPLSLFDNSCGTGRMFAPALPGQHVLYGCDVDGDAIEALSAAALGCGFDASFVNCGMQDVGAVRADVALINPPFGINLQSPFLRTHEGVTTNGRYGPHTSALSQNYAIAQALDTCSVVFAIVPAGQVASLAKIESFRDRLCAVVTLPAGLFRAEGTEVRVSLLVFNSATAVRPVARIDVKSLLDVPQLPRLEVRSAASRPPRARSVSPDGPTIATPVTGDRAVRLVKAGRRIGLQFSCGLVEAKVRNALLRSRLNQADLPQRLPKGVEFAGQAWLDIEHLLIAQNPETMLDQLVAKIRSAGGEPFVEKTLSAYFRNRVKTDKVRFTPFRRWVHGSERSELGSVQVGTVFAAASKRDQMAVPGIWGSPLLRTGAPVTIEVVGSGELREFRLLLPAWDGVVPTMTPEELERRFVTDLPTSEGWTLLHAGRAAAFPELAAKRTAIAEAAGLRDILTWQPGASADCYQFTDIVELSMAPRGLLGWIQGCGKSRGAIGLCLMGGRHNLMVFESHLIPEIVDELNGIGLCASQWQIIDSPKALVDLRKINIISYARLRSALPNGPKRRTYARMLRRRLHTVVADEGDLLSNRDSQQSRALWMLSPKRRYAMTGTPVANYCRDALPLLMWTGGDGTSYQRYGEHQPFIDRTNLSTMKHACRGLDEFRDRHVTLEWAVREFTEDLRNGAKREVPRLRNVPEFREMLAPHLLRRVMGEPEIERWIRVPTPERHVHTIEWDKAHLAAYLKTSWEFSSWFMKSREEKGSNLIALLARINEVCKASNMPHELTLPQGSYAPMTSKQRAAADLLERFADEGRKSLLFGTNPNALRRIVAELERRGLSAVLYTGDIPIKKRTKALNLEFRKGDAHVAAISFGAGKTGLNLPQASRVVFYNRFWTPRVEDQAGSRAVRPQQTDDVEFHYLHLRGGIDEYQAQMVDMKKQAIGAGVDYGEQMMGEGDFLHMDTILYRFCEDLKHNFGIASNDDLIRVLSNAA